MKQRLTAATRQFWYLVMSLVFIGSLSAPLSYAQSGYDPDYPYLYPFYVPNDGECRVPTTAVGASVLNSFSEEERIGQTFIVGFTAAEKDIMAEMVAKYKLGGVFILGNEGNSVYNADFFADLDTAVGIPLIVASDEEGGTVQRFRGQIGEFQSAQDMGSLSDSEVTAIGQQIGEGLAGRGVNTAFSPVADLGSTVAGQFGETSRSRTFSTDPAVVAQKAGAFAAGLRSAGVRPTFKHFPGLSKGKNTDFETSVIDYAQMTDDLKPYESLLGVNNKDIVMLNSSVVTGLTEPGLVADVSPAVVNLVRTTYNHKGLIVTDALEGPGVRDTVGGLTESVPKALTAGVVPIFGFTANGGEQGIIDAIEAVKASGVNYAITLNDVALHKDLELGAAGLNSGDSVFFLGDSLTVGMRDVASPNIASLLAAAPKPLTLTGAVAIGGKRTSWGTEQVAIAANRDAIASSDAIVIGMGTNDTDRVVQTEGQGGQPKDIGTIKGEMQELIDAVRAINSDIRIFWTKIAIQGTVTTQYGTTDMDVAMPLLNQAIEELAPSNNLSLIPWDTYAISNSLLSSDGIHPADYNQMASFVSDSIKNGNVQLSQGTNTTPITGSSTGTFSAEVYGQMKELPIGWVPILAAAGQEFGVDPNILAALLGNETNWSTPESFATNPQRNSATATGPFQFLDLPFRDYADEPDQWSEEPERSKPHTSRVPKLINNGSSTTVVNGSTYHLADGNRDGKVDRATPEDAAYLAAIYLKSIGATTSNEVGSLYDFSVPDIDNNPNPTVRHLGAYFNQGPNWSAPNASSEAEVDALAAGSNHVGRYMNMMTTITTAGRSSGVFEGVVGGSASGACATQGGEGSGLVNADGYAFPLEPQTKAVDGITENQTTTGHWDGTPAFDLFSSDSANVYAIYSGEVVRVNTSYHDIPGCSSIQLKADDGYYYWYGHLKETTVSSGERVEVGQQMAKIADDRNFDTNCWGGAPHLHIDRGCTINGVPQSAGTKACRDPSFIEFLSNIYEDLPG